jgi:S2P endopeptidase
VAGFGLQLIFILPIAYTQIDTDHLQSTTALKKLKIFSAGIWNNLILAALCYILLLLLPFILAPIYNTRESVFITNIKPNAPIRGENGLYVGDSIYKINNCDVTNEDEWMDCLSDTLHHRPAYCVKEDFVHENDESIHEIEHHKDGLVTCCRKNNPAMNCFESFDEERMPQFVCLNIRNAIEHSSAYCNKGKACAEHLSCVQPILPNTSTIIHIKRKNRAKDFVYYGHPVDLLSTTEISQFVPKTKLIEPHFGDSLALMLKYLIVFSSGLAICNILPSFGLDGYLIVNALISAVSFVDKSKKELISLTINCIGTVILFLSVIRIIFATLFN